MLTLGSNTSGDMQNKTWAGEMDLLAGTGNLYLSGLTLAKNGFGGANANITGTVKLGSASNMLDVSGASNPVKIGYSNLTSAYATTGNLTINNLAAGSIITATDDSTAIVVAMRVGTDPRYSNPGGPSVTAAGANLVVTFSRSDASETPGLALVVEAGTDLATWPLVYNIGADTTGSSAGVEITENENAPDTITVTIPKGADEKKFARLRAVVTE